MNIEAEFLIEAIAQAGHEAQAYSGRGMYGKQCVGVTVDDDASMWDLAFDLGKAQGEDGDRIPGPRTDSMGLRMIVYWPRIEWPEGGA